MSSNESVPEQVLAGLRAAGWSGEPLLVAVSGGVDSLAMLHALAAAGLRPTVAHFDHGLRDDSGEDARFVVGQARALGLDSVVERADVHRVAGEKGWNLEEAARTLRYSFLHRSAEGLGGGLIAVGHTVDDQAETVLLQLFRGTAYPVGMRPRRGHVLRPLLLCTRAELGDYLKGLGLVPVEDPSNADRERSRAWVRHEILPRLKTRFPGVVRRLVELAAVQQGLRSDLRSRADALRDARGVAVEDLQRASLALRREMVASLLKAAGAPVSFVRVEEILAALDDGAARFQIDPERILRLSYGRLELIPTVGRRPPTVRVEGPAELPPGLPPSLLDDRRDLVLRGRLPGDSIRLPGGTKKLARWLIDRKVPREGRDTLRVLASGSEVLWVEGVGSAVGVELADPDRGYMERALELAQCGAELGELPVGAVVVVGGEVMGEAHNETEARRDPTAHAEILALRSAGLALGDWRLGDATLYVTLEPCSMCFGAALQAHLARLVFGAANRREGALGGVTDLGRHPWKRSLEVRGGVLAQRSAALLRAFFEGRRC